MSIEMFTYIGRKYYFQLCFNKHHFKTRVWMQFIFNILEVDHCFKIPDLCVWTQHEDPYLFISDMFNFCVEHKI